MEITCHIKGEIKESVSEWSVTGVCPASQLDVEVWPRAAEMALGARGLPLPLPRSSSSTDLWSITFCLVSRGWRRRVVRFSHTSLPMNMVMVPLTEIWGEATDKWTGCPLIKEQTRAQFIACLHACVPSYPCVCPVPAVFPPVYPISCRRTENNARPNVNMIVKDFCNFQHMFHLIILFCSSLSHMGWTISYLIFLGALLQAVTRFQYEKYQLRHTETVCCSASESVVLQQLHNLLMAFNFSPIIFNNEQLSIKKNAKDYLLSLTLCFITHWIKNNCWGLCGF